MNGLDTSVSSINFLSDFEYLPLMLLNGYAC